MTKPLFHNVFATWMYHPQEVGAAVLIDGDMIQISQLQTCFAQTIGDRFARKSRPMFYPAEPLFLGGSDQHPIAHQCCGRIAVKRIESQYDHQARR